jgi:hypothetical protein
MEASQTKEGLNVKLFQMLQGGSVLEIASLTTGGTERNYAKVSPQLNEPLYARPARTVV